MLLFLSDSGYITLVCIVCIILSCGVMEDGNESTESEGFGDFGGGSPLKVTCGTYGSDRLWFDFELRPEETTIVSYKELLKQAVKEKPNHPAVLSAVAAAELPPPPEPQPRDPPDQSHTSEPVDPTSNHASPNVERFEQLDKDELQSDNSETEHKKLGQITQPATSAILEMKKRRGIKVPSEKDDGHIPMKHAKLNHKKMEVSSISPLSVGNSSSYSKKFAAYSEGKSPLPSNAAVGTSRKKSDACVTKCENASQLRLSNKDATSFPVKVAGIENQRSQVIQSKDEGNAAKNKSKIFDSISEKKPWEQHASKYYEPQTKRLVSNSYKGKNISNELPELNTPVGNNRLQPSKTDSWSLKEASSVKPKVTMLERTIRELKDMVAESRPPNIEVQATDSSTPAIKRRLPNDIKQKLAKVARLAQSSEGRISQELINRLMSIVGHLMQIRTLKKNLREMVSLGLAAKREKEESFQQIKIEVTEMIKVLLSSKSMAAKHQDTVTADFRGDFASLQKRIHADIYNMDYAIEDKLCDLYDLYVQGMDEEKVPPVKKLYVELAELWPYGMIDRDGIKNAVKRAKNRRARYESERVQEIVRSNNSSKQSKGETILGATSSTDQARVVQGGSSNDSTHILVPTRMLSNTDTVNEHLPASSRLSNSSPGGLNIGMPKQKETENTSSFITDLVRRHLGIQNKVTEFAAKKPERMTSSVAVAVTEQDRNEYIRNKVKEFTERRKRKSQLSQEN